MDTPMHAPIHDVAIDSIGCAPFAEGVFRQLFVDHFPFVCRALRRLGVHPPDVEDQAQNAFIGILRHLDQYDPSRPVRPWLYGFAVRVASNYRRGAGRMKHTLASRSNQIQPTDSSFDEKAQARQVVMRALEALSFPHRATLVLHDLEEMDAIQIGEILSVPPNTVYSRLRRARALFSEEARRLLASDWGDA